MNARLGSVFAAIISTPFSHRYVTRKSREAFLRRESEWLTRSQLRWSWTLFREYRFQLCPFLSHAVSLYIPGSYHHTMEELKLTKLANCKLVSSKQILHRRTYRKRKLLKPSGGLRSDKIAQETSFPLTCLMILMARIIFALNVRWKVIWTMDSPSIWFITSSQIILFNASNSLCWLKLMQQRCTVDHSMECMILVQKKKRFIDPSHRSLVAVVLTVHWIQSVNWSSPWRQSNLFSLY